MADRHEDKARMFMDSSFLEPVPYDGDEDTPGPPGKTYIKVTLVARASEALAPRRARPP